MKICIVSEREYGCGASIAAFRLAKALADSGHEVHYIFNYPHPGPENQRLSKSPLNQNRSLWKRVTHRFLHRISSKISFRYYCNEKYANLRTLVKAIDPDVINLHNVGTIFMHDAIISLGYEYPIVWTMHDCFAIKPYAYQFVNLSGKLTETVGINPKFVSHRTHQMLVSDSNICFVTPSQWLCDSIQPNVGGHKENLVIPNGLSSEEFFPEDKVSARDSLGLLHNGFHLLFVSSKLEYERKNIRVLLKALDLFQHSSMKVLALGIANPEFKTRYPFIRFFESTCDTAQIRRLYSAADIFVISSLIDNLPNTVLESLFCGTPVVGANVGGIPEMVVPNKTGWLFDPRNPKELADILRNVCRRKELLSPITRKCASWAQEHFSVEKQRDQYLQLFAKISGEDS